MSRGRTAAALAARVAELEAQVRALGGDPGETRARPNLVKPRNPGPWRFKVGPPGRRFGWRGAVYASDRRTGLLEVQDAAFAAALRELATRDRVEELPG